MSQDLRHSSNHLALSPAEPIPGLSLRRVLKLLIRKENSSQDPRQRREVQLRHRIV